MRYRMFVMCCAFSCAFSLSAAYGQEDAPDLAFDSAVAAIGQDATAKGALEEECLSTLKSSDEWADLYRAVRILSVIGTEKSVPVLSEMLVKPERSHLARIALELIPGEEASAVLRDALTKAPEKEAIGIASSLGVRKDSGAVSVLADLAAGDQEGLAQAALAALGHISGKKATEVLKSHILDQNRERAAVAAEALLVALEEAESDTETIAGVYESLLEKSWPDRIRAGAFMRILEEDTEKAVSHILEMVYSNDLFLRSVALASAISLKSGDLVGQLVEELPSLAEDVQARLIESLGKREEGIAEKTLHQFLHSPSEAVRIEAAKALGNNGTSASIAPLAEMIARAEGRT
ncbi:MAG TPA: HEAT repeat domain-containing protein, partial [Candidatus Hydrogenedentes bacterium]|nr:HEAT repeat domain-containing protein [Candidatus Hydrogenedentota bacterium]